MPLSICCIAWAYDPLWIVALVPSTPILLFLVAITAARAVGATTSKYGTGSLAPISAAVELTVPQAASTAFTPCPSRKSMSCLA